MQKAETDLIFLSRDVNSRQERLFRELREIFPEIKRLHGDYEIQHLLYLISLLTEGQQVLVINAGNFDLVNTGGSSVADFFPYTTESELVRYSKRTLERPGPVNEVTDEKIEIVYLTYQEEIAEENFVALLTHYPALKRLHGIKGLTKAFQLSAELVTSRWFVLIDGDNQLLPGFDLTNVSPPEYANAVKIFSSRNPVNGLEYGYGGIKICPTVSFRKITQDTVDPICSGELKPVFVKERTVASITKFNTSRYSAWKAGFRECAMLCAQLDYLTQMTDKWASEKISVWKTRGKETPFGDWAIKGAHDGERFVRNHLPAASHSLNVINDPDWLTNYFNSLYPLTPYE